MNNPINVFWFRRDLRLEDNAGLYHALKQGKPVLPIFIFDSTILEELKDKTDRRVEFIYQALVEIQKQLLSLGSTLDVRYGTPLDVFQELVKDYSIDTVFTNHDYEPYARERDKEMASFLNTKGIPFKTYKDQVLLEKNEVLKDDGRPYTIFTPYSRKWKSVITDAALQSHPGKKYFRHFYQQAGKTIPTLKSLGFQASGISFPGKKWKDDWINNYDKQRDYPGINGTTRLGIHLRFGTISIRELARDARALNQTFLDELIWREFYQMILWHFPNVVSQSFKAEYDKIQWRNNENEFEAWCNGLTGYPIVDAGMRELNETGFMHNRVRMITASFLTKHLLIDWLWGEAYFAKKLLDYELASNNGGWQWAAGSGCDAAPYFRIFNPYLQTKKFDPEFLYIKKWVPDPTATGFEEFTYPPPIVEHEYARKRCLEVYSSALKK